MIPDLLPVMGQGLRAARRSGDRAMAARLLEALGLGSPMVNRPSASREFLGAALALRRELGDRRGEAAALNALGLLDLRTRRHATADGHFLQAAAVYRDLGDSRMLDFHREAGNKRSIGNALRILSAV